MPRIVYLHLLFSVILISSIDSSADLAFSSNSRTFETVHSNLVVKGMAHSCLSLANIPDQLPCNPALAPFNKKAGLSAELLLSNGYANLQTVRSLLDNKFDQNTVDAFFTKDKVIQIEAGADINFFSKYINAQYSPLSVKAFSVVRNEANPDIEFYSLEENGFTFQSGYEFYNDFYVGIQSRFLNRKYINSRFKLTALATQIGREALAPKKQNVVFVEPGISWYSKSEYNPRISLFLANTGFYSTDDETLKKPVESQISFGISPDLKWGDVDIILDYKSLSFKESNWYEKIHLGSIYRFGSMNLTSGIDYNGISAGVFYGLDKFNAGVLYSTTKFMKDNNNNYTQTVYVQLGWQI